MDDSAERLSLDTFNEPMPEVARAAALAEFRLAKAFLEATLVYLEYGSGDALDRFLAVSQFRRHAEAGLHVLTYSQKQHPHDCAGSA